MADFWGPFLPSAAPPDGETPRGISPTRWSGPTSRTQTGSQRVPPPYITSLTLSYHIPPFPRSLPAVPIFPASSGGSDTLLANCCRWTTKVIPSTRMKIPPSMVSHMPIRPSPSDPLFPQLTTSVASSPSCIITLLNFGAHNWGPPLRQTYHTGGTGVGADSLLQDHYDVPRVSVIKFYL